ncbi:multiheme c-type cytochrome [Sulfitobacter sp. LCG007]
MGIARALLIRATCLLAGAALLAPAPEARAQQTPDHSAYVGSERCADCHMTETQAWLGSDHELAWTLPSPETVIADFDGTEFEGTGMTARFSIRDGEYFVDVTESDGSQAQYRVHSVAGIRPLQQYLLDTGYGRLQSFDVVWDAEKGGWYHLYPDQSLPPSNGLHWTHGAKNWNSRCAECHATGFEKNYDLPTRSYASTQSEIGVGCEACHGPGAAHLVWAQTGSLPPDPSRVDGYGFSQSFASAEAQVQQCATCHARREPYGDGNPLPGTPFHDAYGLSLLRPGLYHADGQILDEVYVYGSFLQSKMYAKGVTCTNCHDPHSTQLRAKGNAVCTQCHSPAGNPAFPSLPQKRYDAATHHHHPEGSDGAQCKSCHMIERVYMGIDARRDHSFRIPRPDLAAHTGAPDACTDCHADRTPDWAAERIAAWFPDPVHRGPHYGEVLARGRLDAAAAGPALGSLAADASKPGIVRATALWLLQQSADPGAARDAGALLSDPDPMVRAAAVELQRLAAPQERIANVAGLLADPVRSVRMAAARRMLGAPVAFMPETIRSNLSQAMGEWRSMLASQLDFPEAHLRLAGLALTLRDLPAASAGFREAATLDPQQVPAWVMLARIAELEDGPETALALIDEALAFNPADDGLLGMRAQLSGQPLPLTPPPSQD